MHTIVSKPGPRRSLWSESTARVAAREGEASSSEAAGRCQLRHQKRVNRRAALSLAALMLCCGLARYARADDAGHKTSGEGFLIVPGLKEPQPFDAQKSRNEEDKDLKEFARKILEHKIKLCNTHWDEIGPTPDSKETRWIFSCKDCEEGSVCEIHVVWRGGIPEAATLEKFKFAAGTAGPDVNQSVTAPPGLFNEHVKLVYCECKKKKQS